ncbi:MAG: hypothetical protein H6744_12040 [Deltaproteobacteria bacterium]|nr:hypothetical protein [Deltaproteobacteria bacterium]MCB9787401.1 hypothetical protein [Deltaproteobacteria bacterium]
MSMKTVLTLMAVVGLVLAAYSLRLHEHVLSADEAQARHACRHLCKLGIMDATGATDSAVAGLANAVAASACSAMDDETRLLLDCRDRLLGLGMSVSTYRCVVRAETAQAARACGEEIR